MYKIVPFILAILMSFNSLAGESSHKQQIEEMLELLQVEQQVDETVAEIKKVYFSQISKIKLPDEFKPIISTHQEKAFALISDVASWANQKRFYVTAYSLALNESNAREINNFLKSGPGQEFIESQGRVRVAVKDFTAGQMQSLQQQLGLLSEELKTKIKQQQSQQ